ncbi:hypothetical protein, partial [Aeromonas caviae]|uniref:hypothetical protein n=1 Tax=Aeromonas caviae TaxID=648 RepID=UPI001FBA273B
VGFCLGEGQEIDWIGHTEYSETRIEQLDHIFNLIGMSRELGQVKREWNKKCRSVTGIFAGEG